MLNACAPAGEDDQGVAALHFAATVLAAIRKKKSEEQRPLKTPVARAVIQAPAQQLELLALVEKDLRASGLIRELETSVGDTFEVTVAWRRRRPSRRRCREVRLFRAVGSRHLPRHRAPALAEDLGAGDVTTAATVDPDLRARGEIVAKCDCVIAGLDVAAETFRQLDPSGVFTILKGDGSRCQYGDVVAEVRGAAGAMWQPNEPP